MSQRRSGRFAHLRDTSHLDGVPEGWDFQMAVCGLPDLRKAGNREPYHPTDQDAYEWVKSVQPDVPTSFIVDLRKRVATQLAYAGLKIPAHALPFYTALGTSIDKSGVDFFVEYRGHIVTIDATMRAAKTEASYVKADVLLSGDLDDQGVLLIEEVERNRVAREIAARLIAALGLKR